MLCCYKTGIRIVRCKTKILTNVTTPKSLGYSNDEIILTALVPFASLKASSEDNYNEAGQIMYRSFVFLLDEALYQSNIVKIMDLVEYNDGKLEANTTFNPAILTKRGHVYSVRELPALRKTGKKYREIKVRFDLV